MEMDTKQHRQTYKGFISASKWGTVFVALIVIGVVIIIT
ncbi:MAG: aa3-type cytochrome c oxidase subunit IV [Pseudomonadota bacterium]